MREILCWRGPASVNVFALGTGNTPLPRAAFHLAGLVPDAVLPFPLMEPPEAIARLGLISYDLDFEDASVDLRAFTRAALRRVCESTPAVAWAAFEGAFSYEELLTDQVARQVYGYRVSGAEPRPTTAASVTGPCRPPPAATRRNAPVPGPSDYGGRVPGPGRAVSAGDGQVTTGSTRGRSSGLRWRGRSARRSGRCGSRPQGPGRRGRTGRRRWGGRDRG